MAFPNAVSLGKSSTHCSSVGWLGSSVAHVFHANLNVNKLTGVFDAIEARDTELELYPSLSHVIYQCESLD
jgi:hypothetical protein